MFRDTLAGQWLTWFFGPSLSAILVTITLAIALPFAVHCILYASRIQSRTPIFLLAGASGSGKTTLAVALNGRRTQQVYTSQQATYVDVTPPSTFLDETNQFRSTNDPASRTKFHFRVVDTPGHGKLRQDTYKLLRSEIAVRGLVFFLDASIGDLEDVAFQDASDYLYDAILTIRDRTSKQKSQRDLFHVAIFVNKSDLFTATPQHLMKARLAQSFDNTRLLRSRQLAESKASPSKINDSDLELLGSSNGDFFTFEELEREGIHVDFFETSFAKPGSVGEKVFWEWSIPLMKS